MSISTADKSSVIVLVTARGTSTHASMPRSSPSRERWRSFGARAAARSDPEHPPFLQALAKRGRAHVRILRNAGGRRSHAGQRADAEVSGTIAAIMRTTLAPVLLNAGRNNVIPGSAQATLNVRSFQNRCGCAPGDARTVHRRSARQRDIRSPGRSRSRTRSPSSEATDLRARAPGAAAFRAEVTPRCSRQEPTREPGGPVTCRCTVSTRTPLPPRS
jgi:hypothetical protein